MRLSRRLPYPIAHSVYACGVVALVYCASDRVLVDDVRAVWVNHGNLRACYSGIFRHLGECEVAVVDVEQVVVAGVVVVGECAEVVIHEIADIEVEPAIAIHVGAGDAGGGANVNRIAESGLGDVCETARHRCSGTGCPCFLPAVSGSPDRRQDCPMRRHTGPESRRCRGRRLQRPCCDCSLLAHAPAPPHR